MSDSLSNDAEWEPCVSGELRETVRRTQERRNETRFAKSLAVTTGLLVIALAAGLVSQQLQKRDNRSRQQLTCEQVKQLLPGLVAGQLTAQHVNAVQVHLVNCPRCRPVFRQMLSQMDHFSIHGFDEPRACLCCRVRPPKDSQHLVSTFGK